MKIEIFKIFATFIVLCLAQTLVLNHIHLFGCATPLLYIYFILLFRRNYSRWAVILWSFLTGLCIDIFTNTPGVATSATTILGLLQPYLLNLFIPRDSSEDLIPSIKSLGFLKYLYYSSICITLYTILFFTIETFNFFNWIQWLKNIAGSTAITLLLIIALENTQKK